MNTAIFPQPTAVPLVLHVPLVLQAASAPKYCAVGIYVAGAKEPRLMMASGKVILFDTLAIAQQVLPLIGGGRFSHWSDDRESIGWTPIEAEGVNRCDILTGYDPYRLPAGLPGHLRSETAGKEWHSHVMWSHWMTDCGQFAKRADGTMQNTVLEAA